MTSQLTGHGHGDDMGRQVETGRRHLERSPGWGPGVPGPDGVPLTQPLVPQAVHNDVHPVEDDVTRLPGVAVESGVLVTQGNIAQ